jgi:hypothetical protein
MIADKPDLVSLLIEDDQPVVEEQIAEDQQVDHRVRQTINPQHARPVVVTTQHVGSRSYVERKRPRKDSYVRVRSH